MRGQDIYEGKAFICKHYGAQGEAITDEKQVSFCVNLIMRGFLFVFK